MERGKMSSSGRGGKSKVPQHPQDIFALGSKSTVPVSRDSEKRNIHKPSTSSVERKRDASSSFGAPPPGKRSRIGSPAESVSGTSLEVDPVDLVPHVLQALDTHNSDKLLGLLTGSIRLLKSQRSKPDPILCMSMLYLCKIRPNMFAHDTVTQSLCCLLKREQGAAFKSKGNPLVFVMACNMLYAGHRESKNWPDMFIKVYIEDALNERWWVDCSWCKCLVENITTAFNTKTPPSHLIPTDSTLGTMSPSGSGSPLMGSGEEDVDNTDLEYTVLPRYSSSYENVEGLVLEAIKEQIQRRAAPDTIGKGFLKLLSVTCGFPEIRMISASRLEGWLHSGKLWRAAQELLAHVCVNADATGPTAARDHEVLAQLARMRLKTKPLVACYVSCLREMVAESGALLRSVITHTIYNELSNVRSPNNMAVLAALIQAQPQLVPQAMGETYLELLVRPEDYVRPLRVLIRECVRGARSDAAALVPLARTLASKPHHDPPAEVRERAFTSVAELFCTCCLVVASVHKAHSEWKSHVSHIQGAAVSWLLEVAVPVYRPTPHDYLHALNKILFMESADSYSKVDNWPPESERAAIYRLCCELPLPQHTLLRIIFIGLTKEIPVSEPEALSLIEGVVRRAGSQPEEGAMWPDTPDLPDLLQLIYVFQEIPVSGPEALSLIEGVVRRAGSQPEEGAVWPDTPDLPDLLQLIYVFQEIPVSGPEALSLIEGVVRRAGSQPEEGAVWPDTPDLPDLLQLIYVFQEIPVSGPEALSLIEGVVRRAGSQPEEGAVWPDTPDLPDLLQLIYVFQEIPVSGPEALSLIEGVVRRAGSQPEEGAVWPDTPDLPDLLQLIYVFQEIPVSGPEALSLIEGVVRRAGSQPEEGAVWPDTPDLPDLLQLIYVFQEIPVSGPEALSLIEGVVRRAGSQPEEGAVWPDTPDLPDLLQLIYVFQEIPVSGPEALSLIEGVVRRAGSQPEEGAVWPDTPDLPDLLLQLTHYHPPDNVTLPPTYTVPPLAISSLYWRAWTLLVVIAAHNPHGWAERAARTYPTLRALIEYTITNKPSIEWTSNTADSEAERAAILQLETHLAAASNAKLPVTEHNCRLLSQLTTLDPLGPARRPPAPVLESLLQLSTSLRLGRLLARQPALLLDLVERHGTRRAMPWLHHLLQHEQLELSVLPVQCVCELVCAGGGAGRGVELGTHLRGVVRGGREGARAVLHHYLARLHHHHPPTRAHANRGLKLVLTQTEETEIDYNEDVNPETWLEALYTLPSWEAVREEAIVQLRAACLVETNPTHLSAYIKALARHVQEIDGTHTAIVLDLSQVVMERTCVMGATLPPPDRPPHHPAHLAAHATLHALTIIFTTHINKVRSLEGSEEMETDEAEGEKITVRGGGRLHLVLAHACLKLLCYGPSMYDTNQSLYQWLVSLWTGDWLEEQHEAVLPDWLRLHLIRSARPPLLAAGLRGLPAHKLALFIQTFGMPVSSMTGLLQALDACPLASVLRLGVERGYMCQLLHVQRARGARGGDAFAAALHLTPTTHPADVELFTPAPRPKETSSVWSSNGPIPVSLRQVSPALTMVFSLTHTLPQDIHDTLAQIYTKITQEANSYLKRGRAPTPYTDSVISFLKISSNDISAFGAALMQRVAYSGPLLRALVPHAQFPHGRDLVQISERLLSLYKGAVSPLINILKEMSPLSAQPDSQLPVLPSGATKEQLIAALETSTSNTLEEIGNRIIATQNIEIVTEVLTHILEKSQSGGYEVKSEGQRLGSEGHVLGRKGRGCGLVLDWLADLLPEILGRKPDSQINLMFRSSGVDNVGAVWRPLLVTLLAHRASWNTLHTCLTTLLQANSNCVPSWVVQFCDTLVRSPRVCQGRDPHTPRHHTPDDILALDYKQIGVLVSYVISEMRLAGPSASTVCNRRLSLIVQCAPTLPALLAASLAPFSSGKPLDDADHLFMLLLYMKVPVMSRLVSDQWRPSLSLPLVSGNTSSRSPAGGSGVGVGVGDKVSHTLLTALAHLARHEHTSKEHLHKVSLLESGARGWWVRSGGVGARGVSVVCGLLRAYTYPDPAQSPLLSILEPLDDHALFDQVHTEDLHDILSCYLDAVSPHTGSNQQQQQLLHRLSALLRRYVAYKPNEATQLLNNYRDIILSTPALSPLLCVSGEGPPSSWAPPPGPLAVLAARSAPSDALLAALQEIEWWGSRRGGAWGGSGAAGAVAGALGGLGAHTHPPLRTSALTLLAKLLPALTDTTPGLRVVLECLDSEQPEIAQSVLDKLSELVCGMQEHAVTILTKVFILGMKGRLTVDQALSKCVATINMLRGC